MENLEKSCPVLRLLKHTKFGITDSIVQGTNRFQYNSTMVQFVESIKDITTENCLLPEKLVKFKVCEQNNFLSKSKPHLDNINLKPITSINIKSLEREIQDTNNVLAEKRNVLQSLKYELAVLQGEVIPKVEEESKSQTRKIEQTLADFMELNNRLNSQYNILNESTQNVLSQTTGGDDDALYHRYNFHEPLFLLMQRMCTDFNVVCKYLNSTNTRPCGSWDLELDIELIGRSLPQMRTRLEMIKCNNYAHVKCEEKYTTVKQQLEKGTFKLNMLETTRYFKSLSHMNSDLAAAWRKISDKHSAQTTASINSAYHRLCNIQLSGLQSVIPLLNSLNDGMKCMQSVNFLLLLLVHLEKDSYEFLFSLLSRTHGDFNQLYTALIKQESKLKDILGESSNQNKDMETSAQLYARQLIAENIRSSIKNENLELTLGDVEKNLQQERQKLQREYNVENVYGKLAALRQRMEQKSALIYSGPTRVPMLPYEQHNQLIYSRTLRLAEVKSEYVNLQRDIQGGRHGDSGIESFES